MKKVKCPKCLGTGVVVNHASLGAERRAARQDRGLGLKPVAKGMGITQSHLCYLEQGKRRWSQELVMKHEAACR